MNRRELAALVSDRIEMSVKEVDEVLKAIAPAVNDVVMGGGEVHIRGFGTFYAKKLAPTQTRMPNGQKHGVGARVRLGFRAVRSGTKKLEEL